MTSVANELPASPQSQRGLAWPLVLWLAIQLAALVVAGLQVPLSDKFTRPAERRAIEEMLVTQIAFSAMLFPIILNGFWGTVAAIAAAWPMLALAGVLSVRSTAEIVRGGAYVSLWMGVLVVWGSMLSGTRARLIGCALAAGVSIGGALLAYLRVEFDLTASTSWDSLGPIQGAIGVLDGCNWSIWRGIVYLVVFTGVAFAVGRGAKLLRK